MSDFKQKFKQKILEVFGQEKTADEVIRGVLTLFDSYFKFHSLSVHFDRKDCFSLGIAVPHMNAYCKFKIIKREGESAPPLYYLRLRDPMYHIIGGARRVARSGVLSLTDAKLEIREDYLGDSYFYDLYLILVDGEFTLRFGGFEPAEEGCPFEAFLEPYKHAVQRYPDRLRYEKKKE